MAIGSHLPGERTGKWPDNVRRRKCILKRDSQVQGKELNTDSAAMHMLQIVQFIAFLVCFFGEAPKVFGEGGQTDYI